MGGGAGYSLDFGQQASTSGDAKSSGQFNFGGITVANSDNTFLLLGLGVIAAIVLLKK